MANLIVKPKNGSRKITPFELTYHLTPWSTFSFVIETKAMVNYGCFRNPSVAYHQVGERLTVNCLDHSVDALSVVNYLSGQAAYPEVYLTTERNYMFEMEIVQHYPTAKAIQARLSKDSTARLIKYCHASGNTITAVIAETFRQPKTKVAIATNLRRRLGLPEISTGNLSGGIIFDTHEKVTGQAIQEKLGQDLKDLIRLINTNPAQVAKSTLKLNAKILYGGESDYPRLIVSNLGVVNLAWIDGMYFIPPTVPIENALTIGVVTVNGQLSLVLSSKNLPGLTSEEVINTLEAVCA